MGHIKIFGKTKIEGKTVFPPPPLYDSTAADYIAAVEAADGQALENSIKTAYNDFIVGCKADGIWTALKASCLLAGARTLSGALVPLVGTAPTNNNFVSGDYDRKTGLNGNGSTKYLNTNVAGNSSLLPQDNAHISIYSYSGPTATMAYLGNANAGTSGSVGINRFNINLDFTAQTTGNDRIVMTTSVADWAGFKGISRGTSNSFIVRNKKTSTTISRPSTARMSATVFVHKMGPTGRFGNGRHSYYSIGESLDLAKLDARVSAFMTAINAAI
jgi:hypothetical protein